MTWAGTAKLTASELKTLLSERAVGSFRYFLRWPHAVSGFVTELQEPLSPEGQLITASGELRWKQRGERFDVLYLACDGEIPDKFTPIDAEWESPPQTYPVVAIRAEETRYPNVLKHQVDKHDLQQCYFRDRRTGTVHFVALTMA